MGRHRSSVKINSVALMKFLKEQGYTKAKLARSIGYSRECISRSINAGKMDYCLLNLIGWHFLIDADQFKENEQ